MYISSNLVKFGFGFYKARLEFGKKIIVYSLFDTHIRTIHVHSVEDFLEDCVDELEVKRRGLSRFTITQVHLF